MLAGSLAEVPRGRRGVVAEPGRAGDLAALGLDLLELVEADLVQVPGFERRAWSSARIWVRYSASPFGADQSPFSSRLAARYSPRRASRKAASAG